MSRLLLCGPARRGIRPPAEPPAPVLGTISDLSAAAGVESAVLSWTAAANATSHQPQYSDDGETWSNFGSALSGSADGITVTGLTAGVEYSFRVIASDGSTQTISNTDTATPQAAPEWASGQWDLTVDGLPGALDFDANTVTLPVFGTLAMTAEVSGESATISYTVPSVGPGSMSLTHSNGSLSGTATAGGSTVPVTGERPPAPGQLSAGTIVASPGDTQVTISQGAAPSGGTGGPYTSALYRSTTSGQRGSLIVPSLSLPYVDTDLTNGTTYYYVREVDDGATTADTPQVSAVPQEPSAVQPFFEDDFEGYSVGSTVAGGGNARFTWAGSRETRVSDLISHTGTRSLRFRFDDVPEDNHVWAEQRFSILGTPLTEVWVEYYMYYPDGTEGIGSVAMAHWDNPTASDNNKFFRLWGGGHSAYSGNPSKVGMSTRPRSGVGPEGIIFFEYTRQGSSGTGPFDGPSPTAWEDDLGRWIQVRQYYRHVSAPGADDGIFRLWKDGQLWMNFPNVNQNYTPQYPYWDSGYILGADNSHIATQAGGQILIFIDGFKMYDQDPGW